MWPRLVIVTLLAAFNSFLGLIETLLFRSAIEDTEIDDAPVFILGHPRTGTTMLHGLMSLDENFSYCNTFCAGFPSCFLWFEAIGRVLFKPVLGRTRPMDNVKLGFDLPQEDELATCLLSGGISPYMVLYFMSNWREFQDYFAFERDTDEKMRWREAFLYLMKKLTLRAKRR